MATVTRHGHKPMPVPKELSDQLQSLSPRWLAAKDLAEPTHAVPQGAGASEEDEEELTDELPEPVADDVNAFLLARLRAKELSGLTHTHKAALESAMNGRVDPTGSGLDASPLCNALREPSLRYRVLRMFISGFSAQEISLVLSSAVGVSIPVADLEAFRALIPASSFLPPDYLVEKYGGIAPVVDPSAEINRLLRVMRERMGAAVFLEELEGEPSMATNALAESFFRMLSETIKLRQSLGELPGAPSSGPSDTATSVMVSSQGNGTSLRVLVESRRAALRAGQQQFTQPVNQVEHFIEPQTVGGAPNSEVVEGMYKTLEQGPLEQSSLTQGR